MIIVIIRNGQINNVDKYINIYKNAMEFMKKSGNPNQWTEDHHPDEKTIIMNLNNNSFYEVYDDINKEVAGCFVLISGIDETYLKIDGKWLNDEPYVAVHMVAKNSKYRGIFKLITDYAKAKFKNIRIDTHNDNKIMQANIINAGFKYCGIIYLNDKNHSPRLAYHYSK